MGRTPWATEEESTWLLERLPDFRVACANETSTQFLAATNQAYFDKFWPGAIEDGRAVAGPNGVTFKARKQQIYWWFWNRRFGKTGVKKAHEGIDFSTKKPGKLQPYQAYMSLFKDTVMLVLKERYKTYKTSVAEDEECDIWWSFAMEQAKEMLEIETEVVKAQVEKYCHDRAHVEQGLDGFLHEASASNPTEDIDLHTRARHIQGLLDALPQSLQTVLDSLEQQTGWKGTFMVGGPRPEMGKFAVLCLHQGRTMNLGNLFSEATPHWPTIEAAYSKFIVSCFPQDVCQKVHEAYRGLVAPDTKAADAESTLCSQAAEADNGSKTVDSDSPPPGNSDSSMPTTTNVALEVKTKKRKEKNKAKARATENAEPTYDELREEQIHQNRAHMESLGLMNAAAALKMGKKHTRKAKKTQSSEATPAELPANGASEVATLSSAPTTHPVSSTLATPSESAPALSPAENPPPIIPTFNSSSTSPLPTSAANETATNICGGLKALVIPPPSLAPNVAAVVPSASTGIPPTTAHDSGTSATAPLAGQAVSAILPHSVSPNATAAATVPSTSTDTPPTTTNNSTPPPNAVVTAAIPAAPTITPQTVTREIPTSSMPALNNVMQVGGSLPAASLEPLPGFIADTLKYFKLIEGGPAWRTLVSSWVKFERKLGFPESSQDRSHWLSAKDHPEEVKMWTKCARSYDKLPPIKSAQQYAVGWKHWWVSLQPQSRVIDPIAWPPACVEPSDDEDWRAIRRGGPNGMFLVVVSLAWWLWAAVNANECKLDVEKAILDVTWVCETASAMLSSSRKRSVELEEGQGEDLVAKRIRRK